MRIKARGDSVMTERKAEIIKSKHWEESLSSTNTVFDYLIVIDGQGVNETLFCELKKRNPAIHIVNYLYDTTYGMYHFEELFHFYHRVFTFDNKDASKYQIQLLPIYWQVSNIDDNTSTHYNIFGLGAYSSSRYRLYSQIKTLADEMGLRSFVKLVAPPVKHELLQKVKITIKKLLDRKDYIPLNLYKTNLVSSIPISTDEFRHYIQISDVILDTKVLDQAGLTARFMWALGAGKKIITTNAAVMDYDFYNTSQILVLEDCIFTEEDKQAVRDFICTEYVHTKDRQLLIERYRLDNWLRTVMS